MREEALLRSAELVAALQRAVSGDRAGLFRILETASGLPGPRINWKLAEAFSHDCAKLGERADALAYAMAELPANEARGAGPKEFLVVCGVLAVGARATASEDREVRERALALFETLADDLRFRVRESIPHALAMLGSVMKADLAARLETWMESYFQGTAVVLALGERAWLETFPAREPAVPLDLLEKAWFLAHEAPRSAQRYPGWKALVEALGTVPALLALHFRIAMYDRFQAWAERTTVPELREAMIKNLDHPKLKTLYLPEQTRIRAALEANATHRRDTQRAVKGMRGRGKKQR